MRRAAFLTVVFVALVAGYVWSSNLTLATSRNLSENELAYTYGLCSEDCNGVKDDPCSGRSACDGCQESTYFTADCGVQYVYTGNQRQKCTSGDDDWGWCKSQGSVDCYQYHKCQPEAEADDELRCGSNGNCTGGSKSCIECYDGGPYLSMKKKSDYICDHCGP